MCFHLHSGQPLKGSPRTGGEPPTAGSEPPDAEGAPVAQWSEA